MLSDGGLAGVIVGIFFGCLLVIGIVVLVTLRIRRSMINTRQRAVQAAIDESEEVDGFQVIAIPEKQSLDSDSLASSISDMSPLNEAEGAPKPQHDAAKAE
ncbi:hypothetical protein LPJ63_003875 [Coemansia sp. RSA 2711]|nr:hypothetical protein LPJ63_003875 [Coemansia sp. RSA 2711]KAJ2368521.1 hypothetical protein H4S01_001546 [Coemansia sp. RSA 2610]